MSSWKRKNVYSVLMIFPDGRVRVPVAASPADPRTLGHAEGPVFTGEKEAIKFVRAMAGIEAGTTHLITLKKAKGNCSFCELDLKAEFDYILYTIERDKKLYCRLIDKAERYIGDILGEIAEHNYEDQGGSLGMVEGRFELTEDDINCAMAEALDMTEARELVEAGRIHDFQEIIKQWRKDRWY